jgi:hypothetical protein
VQIYDEKMRDQLRSLYAAIASPDYVRVPGIENVVQTANLRGTKVPSLWREPTLVLHRPQADLACAQAIERILQPQFTHLYEGSSTSAQISIRALPATYKSERHVIELWLPPKNMASAE